MTNIAHAHPALADALAKKGYSSLTPVQDAVLEPELVAQDLLVSAQTGSGKTVAFGLAMAPTILEDAGAFMRADAPLALAIAPTRELALQVKRELDWLYREAGAKTASCVGGMDMRDERRILARGVHIVVGTPGRLVDHIKRGSLDMNHLKAIILDEADEMLNMGFREELETILGRAPEERRTLMFSATVPKAIVGLTKKYQRDAVRVHTAAEAKQHLDIEYRAMTVGNSDKENAIINVLRYYNAKNAIVFGDTRVAVNRMTQRFNNRGFSVVALSGELSQKERTNALQALRDGRAQVCIATDVAARGLDLPDLELVIHSDVPKNRESLLHRSGRTGRAGRKGVSAIIITPNRRRNAERLLRDAKITAEWSGPPSAEDIIARDNERLFADMALDSEVTDEERTMVTKLLKAHSPEHIATAFLRQYRAGQSAPEELTHSAYDPSVEDRGARKGRSRNDFSGGVWFSLNLGRKQKAEPKWIMPMLMKSGGLKKPEIGAIKITETQTFIEVAPDGVERFMDTIGPDMKIEKAITATRLNGQPDFDSRLPNRSRNDKSKRGYDKDRSPSGGKGRKKDRGKDGGKNWSKDKPKDDYKRSKPKSDRDDAYNSDTSPAQRAENDERAYDKPQAGKPKSKSKSSYDEGSFKRKTRVKTSNDSYAFGGDKPKKPHKKKLARAAGGKAAGGKGKGGVAKGARKSTRKKDR